MEVVGMEIVRHRPTTATGAGLTPTPANGTFPDDKAVVAAGDYGEGEGEGEGEGGKNYLPPVEKA